jgi:hypothetical protein
LDRAVIGLRDTTESSMTKIDSKSSLFLRRGDVMSAVIDDELVMMSVEDGKYFNLNPVAAHIWRLIEIPQSLDAIVAALVIAYDAPETAIRAEVTDFLERLGRENMVQRIEAEG